jgi:hypothetical protein
MAKRRKRRSQKSFDLRLAKELRAKRISFLRELSEMVSNAVGIHIRCSFAGGDVVIPKPKKSGKVERKVGHVAGYGTEQHAPDHVEPRKLASDDVGDL